MIDNPPKENEAAVPREFSLIENRRALMIESTCMGAYNLRYSSIDRLLTVSSAIITVYRHGTGGAGAVVATRKQSRNPTDVCPEMAATSESREHAAVGR
jgi:hypothetical protein